MRFFTKTLSSGSLSLATVDGAFSISVQANDTSSANIIGGIPFRGENPSSINIQNGEGLTITSTNPASPIDGVTVTWVSGTIDIIIGF